MNVSSRFDVSGFGAIVTGGASGLGLAYGEVLAAHGARVTLIDVDEAALAAEVARLEGEGLDVRGAVADVTDHAALDSAIDEAAGAYGRLDVAFANAGVDSASASSPDGPEANGRGSRKARSSGTPTSAGTASSTSTSTASSRPRELRSGTCVRAGTAGSS